MASLNKNDRDNLYSAAARLVEQASRFDQQADVFAQCQMHDRAEGHRKVAAAMREEASECRRLADAWRGAQ